MPGLLQVVVGPVFDALYSISAIERQRKKIVPEAQGVVLEIGIGEGLNLPWYDPAKVTRVVGIDPDIDMMVKARRRNAPAPIAVDLVEASAEHIPFASGTFDTVVLTYSSGAIADIAAALTEMRRVLKPTGHLIFCDHGRSHDRDVALLQDRIDPWWQQIRGSHLNRDLVVLLDDAGFRIETLDTFYALPRPKILSFHYVGSAVLAS
ncbi:MAG TPA: methyltransferase domain-containing protein [Aestuariivirgaceae bacterium]|nr:methyltransferase domain-containing protein [Aestuariivirgaceae bacterium]